MWKNKLFWLCVLALVWRLALVGLAHHGDLNNNISWGNLLVERGPVNFYGSSDANDWPYSAPNQPPLTLLMFGGTSLAYNFIDQAAWILNNSIKLFPSGFVWYWEASGMDLLVKLPGILADLGIAYLIYAYVTKRLHKEQYALIIAGVWLFNPLTWYNSAVWGQTDPIVNLLGLLAAFALLDKRLTRFAVFLTLSLLFKGSLAVLLPVFAVVALNQKYPIKTWVWAAGYSLLTALAVSVWFHPQIDLPVWLAQLYTTRILPGEIGYLTANAFNLWWLVNPGKVLDSVGLSGVSARAVGLVLTTIGIGGVLVWLRKPNMSKTKVFYALALSALVAFVFLTRMHERYLYPFFPYATLLLATLPWIWLPYVLLSVIHVLNLYHLFWAPAWPALEHVYTNDFFMVSLAMLHVLVVGYLYWRVHEVKSASSLRQK